MNLICFSRAFPPFSLYAKRSKREIAFSFRHGMAVGCSLLVKLHISIRPLFTDDFSL